MSNDPSSSSSSTRRILSRSKQNEGSDTHSSRTKSDSSSRSSSSSHVKSQTKSSSTSSTSSSSNVTLAKEVKNADIKSEQVAASVLIADASFSSVANVQTQHQQQIAHNLAINYINKEPFNEDIEIEECGYYQDMKWRKKIIENFKQILEDIKKLQLEPVINVRFNLTLLDY